ncbi:hypothetical protein CHX27_14660 [Flavobacterium aurantiibacter]|uniref:Uncharacterized protein n=1 Tax=Flavobacterium aurantiibacter TaxID=2023067 RepID=A0A255ZAY8_9FLAO|nr:hypothetical protein CHX27_14660 [Flavobacterium aurantiibacter]
MAVKILPRAAVAEWHPDSYRGQRTARCRPRRFSMKQQFWEAAAIKKVDPKADFLISKLLLN